MAYLLAVLIPLAVIAVIVIFAKGIAAHSFKCKHCSKEFWILWAKVLKKQREVTIC